jgi:uncharacterized protein YbjT (DUF2867 family)
MESVPQIVAIVGAAGKVGYATAVSLRQAGVPVRAILRNSSKEARLVEIGCEVSVADIQDSDALAAAIRGVDTVQIILPVAPEVQDTGKQMFEAIESLASAVEKAHARRVLAISDYGAHVMHDIGMPTMFHAFEKRLSELNCEIIILRSAPHMEGWARATRLAAESGMVPSFYNPADMPFPTISAADLGTLSAKLLLRSSRKRCVEIVHGEGPRRYSANDVAAALSTLLGRNIAVKIVPRKHWDDQFQRVMNRSLAQLLVRTNDAQNNGLVDVDPNPGEVLYGTTDLIDALRPLLGTARI